MTKNVFIILRTWIADYLITARTVFLSALVFSCHEPDEAPVSLRWVPSEFARYGSGFFSFRTGEDNSLYTVGFVDNEFGVHKAVNGNLYEPIVKLDFPAIAVQDFAVFKQTVYLLFEKKLWKVNGAITEEINFGSAITAELISGVYHLNGELLVAGKFKDGMNNRYGMVYSDDGEAFKPVQPVEGAFDTPGWFSIRESDRVFLTGSNSHQYEYDRGVLGRIEYSHSFLAVDSNNNFFSLDRGADGTQQIMKWANGMTTKLGEPFSQQYKIYNILLKDDHIIATGDNSTTGISISYFFDGNDWIPIPTTNYFFGVFKHNGGIFGYTVDGIIAELVYG